MYGFVYIPKKDKESVEKFGLLSVKEQVKHGFINLQQLQRKYGKQMKLALENFPDLERKIGKRKYFTIDDFITYLDWREEITERGSNAIYFLYKPIPYHYLQKIDDFGERIMYKIKIPKDWTIVPIGGDKPKYAYQWEQKYKKISNQDQLWFQHIPHFMVIPPIGTSGVLLVQK